MKHSYLLSAAVALSAIVMPCAAVVTPALEKNAPAGAARWVDSVYNTLTERQRVAQLVFPTVNPKGGESSKGVIRTYVKTDACGGLLFSEGSYEDYSTMINYAQSLASVPLLITYDGEWGLSMRIKEAPRFPKNMALGAIQDYRLIYDYGKEVARECRLAGVHVNFAPDADVNSNPSNPVIGIRSFGEDPQRVAKAATAYSLGLEDGGVQAVAKHFPGHGDTDVDSHKALPSVNHSRATLDATDLVPFRDFIGAGCSGVMVGHISVPSLDATSTPASLSKPITTGVLRDELGFGGLVYTDALAMKGAVDPKGRNNALAALEAGADVLLNPTRPAEAIDAILTALKNGKISSNVIEERCKRILLYKYILTKGATKCASPATLRAQVNTPEAEALIKKLAAASMTLLRNEGSILPLDIAPGKKVAVINLGAKSNNDFMETCRLYAEVEPHYTMGEAFSASSLAKINANEVIVVAVYDDKAATRENFAALVKAAKKPVVAVFFTNPYKLQKFSSLATPKALLLAYEDIPAARVSAAEALFGGIEVNGKLPVNLKGIAPLGTGIELAKTRLGITSPVAEGMAAWLTDSLDAVVRKGLDTKAFPGCQVLVAKNGNIVYNKAFGRFTTAADSRKVNLQTAYDLASVSKATGTLSGIMKAYDQGLLDLEQDLATLVPELPDSAKGSITVKDLLFHETGMPAGLNMFTVMLDTNTYEGKLITSKPDAQHSIKIQRGAYGNNTAKLRTDILAKERSERFPIEGAKGIFMGKETYDTVMGRIYNIPLRANRNYNYSCLNFCILMDLEQRATGRPHDEFVATEIWGPLGAYRSGYRPHTSIGVDNVPPTEDDTFLRKQLMKGYVHDELSNFSGGVQGNAGFFGNATDIAKYCQMLLNGGTYGGHRILSEETAELFTTAKSPTCRRGLGFDKPDTENLKNSPTCDEANAEVFGHLGFTGTVFWVAPSQDLIFVFLTNRVYPTRDNAAFNKLNIRPKLFSLINRSL
ncbi:MAG: serine hydrolase [Bacteroidales bacterium]|nr:serine hydrolase [Bacteroidales bacterium]